MGLTAARPRLAKPHKGCYGTWKRKTSQGEDGVSLYVARCFGKNCLARAKNEPKAGEVAKYLRLPLNSKRFFCLFFFFLETGLPVASRNE